MAQQNNILSFDKARQGASRYRASSRARGSVQADRYAGLDYYDERYGSAAGAYPSRRAVSSPRLVGSERHAASRAAAPSIGAVPSSRFALDGASAVSVRRGGRTAGEDVAECEEAGCEPSARERRAQQREHAKRSRAKAKAERAFNKQFGGSPAAGDAGPRAAVYKGEMGAKHRQAARMQTEGGKGSRGFGFSLSGLAGFALSLMKRPHAAVCASALVCLVLSGAFLYPAARTYYQAVREEARLEVEYEALEQRNEALESSVAYLQTDAGVEARARSQYGWVMEGEQAAKVSGVEAAESSADISAKVLSDEVKPPETWYSPLLDPLFGVKG